jgi:enoyl-CoA hydratase/carnithine racemase
VEKKMAPHKPYENLAELHVTLEDGVAVLELDRPPHNFFDMALFKDLAGTLEALDQDDACRAVVLASAVRSFCAGADLVSAGDPGPVIQDKAGAIYREGLRLFATAKPIVGAIHGPAVGGGLGLALVCDLRVTCAEAYFSANFCRLGIHPGFGVTFTLPRLIGPSRAAEMFYTGRRVGGEEAFRIGLADVLAGPGEVRARAVDLAQQIATSAPLAVRATRKTLHRDLVERVREAMDRELTEQTWLSQTADFREGVAAGAQKRTPVFTGA